jgi:hypothetical protein
MSLFRRFLLRIFEVIGLYNQYAQFRFNMNRNLIIPVKDKPKKTLINIQTLQEKSKSLLIVIPSNYAKNWKPAEGNFYFEIFESAKEKYPEWEVKVYHCEEEKEWHGDLSTHIKVMNPDILLISSELDPNGTSEWSLDLFVYNLSKVWHGTICYLLFDSAFPLHVWRIKRLIRINSMCFIVAIDRDLSIEEKMSALCVGPIFLPISQKSMEIIRELIAAKIKEESLEPMFISFIGQEYPYRKKLLVNIEREFPNLKINPQLDMANPKSYLSYMTALSLSTYTVNLSRQHVIKRNQLKCRVLEAALTGSHVISDELKYTGVFLEVNKHFFFSKFDTSSLRKLRIQARDFNPDKSQVILRAEAANTFFF